VGSFALALAVALVACQRGDPDSTAQKQAPTPAPATTAPKSVAPGVAPSPAPTADPAPRPVPPLPDPLPGKRRPIELGKALAAAIGDFDGDHDNEIVVADTDQLRVVKVDGKVVASIAAPSGIDVLTAADIDGDGRAEILAGWGMSREHRDAPARVVAYRLVRDKLVEESILTPQTSRAQVVTILPWDHPNELFIAYYSEKYMVKSVVVRRGSSGWETTPVAELRMATSYARGDVDGDGKPDLVVGRVYGDAKGADGDAFVLAPDGTRKPIKVTRGIHGAHGVAIADGAIFLADGWHQNYAASGRGLVTTARAAGGAFNSELVEDTAGQYVVERVEPAHIGGHTAIVTMGNQYVRVFTHSGAAWQGLTVGGAMRDVAVGNLDKEPGDEILLVGEHSEIVKLP
jgi:hypothetical protein